MRKKILSVYGVSKLTLVGFVAVVFVDLHYLDTQIAGGQAVADLRRAALEMRRDEKNLFLYGDVSGLRHLAQEAKEARRLLVEHRATFDGVAGRPAIARLARLIDDYERALLAYPGLPPAAQGAAQEAIREQGGVLYTTTREILTTERVRLAERTAEARDLLLLALVVVILLEIASGLYLAHSVVRPLRELETGLGDIDAGRARELALPSNDAEIRSFVTAFNAMLRHMRRQQDQVKRNEKAAALGVLVSGVAHELNNPLSNISTSVQLLIEDGESVDADTRLTWLEQIDSETERARRIVRRLLDSVRHPKLQLQSVLASDLAASSLALVNRHMPASVQVCVDVVEDVELVLDRERMHQVFINLIKNAADAGAQHITLAVRQAPWPGDCDCGGQLAGDSERLHQTGDAVCFTVADDGPGIDQAVREHIFDPFVTTRVGGEGTGLGLYLVEEIVSEHHGCIVLESPERGARFAIWLPRRQESAA